MKALDRINNYVNKPSFKIIVTEQSVNIINYKEIKKFDVDEIVVRAESKDYSVRGKDLSLIRLLENELLIKGEFEKIELE